MSTEPNPTETLPIEPTAENIPADPSGVKSFNTATLNPDAPAEVLASEVEGAHETIFAGNADSLGSLNAVLNRLTAEKRKVLQIRRVWAVRLSVEKPTETP